MMINVNHKPRKNCKCMNCKEARKGRCRNPHKCGVGIRKLLNNLKNEWHLLDPEHNKKNPPVNELILEKIKNGKSTLFVKDMQNGPTLGEGFQILTEEEPMRTNSRNTEHGETEHNKDKRIGPAHWVQVYTDGSCINNGHEDAMAGAGV